MSNIIVNSTGNGSAYVDTPNPTYTGEVITIYAYPASGASLIDITMDDQNGYPIAVSVTTVQQIAYDITWGDCIINVTFSHDIITVNSNGNGWAVVDNPYPDNGDSVRLSCTPGSAQYEVTDIIITDSNSNSWHLPAVDDQYFTYDSSWGDITIDVYFDEKFIYKNLWLLFRRKWWTKSQF